MTDGSGFPGLRGGRDAAPADTAPVSPGDPPRKRDRLVACCFSPANRVLSELTRIANETCQFCCANAAEIRASTPART